MPNQRDGQHDSIRIIETKKSLQQHGFGPEYRSFLAKHIILVRIRAVIGEMDVMDVNNDSLLHSWKNFQIQEGDVSIELDDVSGIDEQDIPRIQPFKI